MILFRENIVTDLRRLGIHLSQELFDAINEFADIQNSYVSKLNIARWQDVKGKTVLFVKMVKYLLYMVMEDLCTIRIN